MPRQSWPHDGLTAGYAAGKLLMLMGLTMKVGQGLMGLMVRGTLRLQTHCLDDACGYAFQSDVQTEGRVGLSMYYPKYQNHGPQDRYYQYWYSVDSVIPKHRCSASLQEAFPSPKLVGMRMSRLV